MHRLLSFLSRHSRAIIVLGVCVLALDAGLHSYSGILTAILGIPVATTAVSIPTDVAATAVEVTISRPGAIGSLHGSTVVVYHRVVTDMGTVRRLQGILNGARVYHFPYETVQGCYFGGDQERHFYTYDARFMSSGVTTQEFIAGDGCFMSLTTRGEYSPDTRLDPLDAAGWSAVLDISPPLPDVPPGASPPINGPTPIVNAPAMSSPSPAMHSSSPHLRVAERRLGGGGDDRLPRRCAR